MAIQPGATALPTAVAAHYRTVGAARRKPLGRGWGYAVTLAIRAGGTEVLFAHSPLAQTMQEFCLVLDPA